jgi:tRNA(His) 5'-end guanylyltransferase
MIELMSSTMFEAIKEIDGAVFGYQQSDEISFILRNDQELDTQPWFDNRVQKLASITSALVTYLFNGQLRSMGEPPNLAGQTIFDARVFTVPDYSEAVNNMVFRQQDCMRNALTQAVYAGLGKKHGKKNAFHMIEGKSQEERLDLLLEECGIDFARDYPLAFTHGIGAYRAPKMIETVHGKVTRHKWIMDLNLPKFTEDRGFLLGIVTAGSDVFRPERDMEKG